MRDGALCVYLWDYAVGRVCHYTVPAGQPPADKRLVVKEKQGPFDYSSLLPIQQPGCTQNINIKMRQPGIEPGASAWEADILPLNH